MERTLKELKIETVISAVGGEAVMDQIPLVQAIKAVGTIKVTHQNYPFETTM